MGGKVGKAILGVALIGASFLVPGLGLGAYLTTALAGALVAQGTGMLLQAFYGVNLENRQQGIEINSANPLAPLPVVYGKTRLGLRMVDMRVAGKNLYIVGALCHGSEDGTGIEAIDEVYFNDKLAFDAAGVAQEGVAKRTENVPQPGGGFTPTVVSLATVTKYLGTDAQTADPAMVSGFPSEWNADCRGRGVAYVVIKCQWHEKLYPMGIPNVVVVVRGNKVYDPRSATTGYSTNPMLHVRDYLRSTRYGVAAPVSELDDVAFQAMANYCDEMVTVPGPYIGNTYREIIAATVGSPCEITTNTNHGRTNGDRISIGVRAPVGLTGLVGEHTVTVTAPNKMTLNGSTTAGAGYNNGSCAMVAMVTQKRFESNGWLDVSRDPRDNISDLLTACRGNLVYVGGVYSPFIRRVVSPVTGVAITEANILSDFVFSDQGLKDAPNLAKVKFINPLKNYAPDEVQWPRPGVVNALLAEDGGFESVTEMNLPFTQDRTMAQQIGMVTVRESRGALVCELVMNEEGLLLAVGDVVPVTHSTPGWSAKPFWVMGVAIVGAHSVKVTLLEYSSGAYSMDEQQITLGDPDTDLPDPTLSGPPTGVSVSNSSVVGTDGSVINTLTLVWTAPSEAANPNLDHYQIRYKMDFETEWRPAPDPKLNDLQAVFPGVGVGNWLIQIRAINSLGTSSDWVQATITVAGGTGTGGSTPATVAGLAASFVAGNIEANWTANAEADLAGYEVREGGASWAASAFLAKVDATKFTLLKQYITKRSYTLRIKPFTRSGTYSVADATVVVSQPIPNAGAIGGGDITVESRLGKMKVFVDLTGTGATQARLYASISSGFGPVVADRYAERMGNINSDRAVFEFTLPTIWFGATIYCKIGLKDELSDQLAEAEQFSSQFSIVGKRVILDDDVDDGPIFKRTLEVERNSTWKAGENLVANPSGEAGDYRNWKQFVANNYSPSDTIVDPNGGSGLTMSVVSDALLPAGVKAFEFAGDGRAAVSQELIPVETSLRYILTAWARQATAGGGTPRMYFGLTPYNKDGIRISPQMFYHPGNVTTTLAAAVNPSDTTITLTDASGFPDESGSGFNTYIALNVDVGGKTDIPNVQVLRYTSKSGNVLTLTAAVPAGVSAANGTSVRFHRATSNHIYNPMSNVDLPTANYQEYTGAIEGEMTMTEAMSGALLTKFWPGTRYVRIYCAPNNGSTGGTNRDRVSRATLYQATRDRDVKDVGASKLGSGTDLSLPSVIKESGGKEVRRLLAKTLPGDSDTLDGVPEGVTYGRPLQTGLTTGQVDLSKAGVINKLAQHILRTGGGATLQAIVAKLTDSAELMRTQRLEGQNRTLVQGLDTHIPNAGFEIWESASQPHAWVINTAGGASAARETTIKRSGDCSLKYVLPASAGWQGIKTSDPTVGDYCVPLKPGRSYKFKISSRASRVAEGQKYRIYIDDGVYTDFKEFTYQVVNTWQPNEWTVTVPTTVGPNCRVFIEFNQNGYAGGAVDCYVDQLEVDEIEVQTYFDNGDKSGDFTIDWANGPRQRVRITGTALKKITMANPVPGALVSLAVERANAGGNYDWATTNISWPEGQRPLGTVIDGHQDIYVFTYDSTDAQYRCIIASLDHADLEVQVVIGRIIPDPALNGTRTVKVGFRPKAMMFFHNNANVDVQMFGNYGNFGWGAASWDGSSLFQWGVACHIQNGAGTANVNSLQRTDCIAAYADDAGALDGKVAVDSVSDTGFIVKTTDAFTGGNEPIIDFIAIGGASVDAQAGWFATSAGTGSKAITGVGFKPKGLILSGIGATATTSQILTTGMCAWLGAAHDRDYIDNLGSGLPVARVIAAFAQDNIAADNAESGFYGGPAGGEAIVLYKNNSGTETYGVISSFDSDGFTLNLTANGIGTAGMFFLALDGVKVQVKHHYIPVPYDSIDFRSEYFTPLATLIASNRRTFSDFATRWVSQMHLGFGAAVKNDPPTNDPSFGVNLVKEWAISSYNNDSPASGNTEVRAARTESACIYTLDTATTAAIAEKASIKRWERSGMVAEIKQQEQEQTMLFVLFGI